MRFVVVVVVVLAAIAGCTPRGPAEGEGEGADVDAGFPPRSFSCSLTVTCEDQAGQFTSTDGVIMCAPDANDAVAHACDSVDCGTATFIGCSTTKCDLGGGCICGFKEEIAPCPQ